MSKAAVRLVGGAIGAAALSVIQGGPDVASYVIWAIGGFFGGAVGVSFFMTSSVSPSAEENKAEVDEAEKKQKQGTYKAMGIVSIVIIVISGVLGYATGNSYLYIGCGVGGVLYLIFSALYDQESGI